MEYIIVFFIGYVIKDFCQGFYRIHLKKKGKLCGIAGHEWRPIFIKGEYNNKMIKFIACSCINCGKGYEESYEIHDIAKNRVFGTWTEKYFDEGKNEKL